MKFADFAGWIPIQVCWHQAQPTVEWSYLGDIRFTEPFFDQTIERSFQHPFNLLFRRQTSLAALTELQTIQPGIAPTGFIFHLSRCGSTLVAQMLASLPQAIVISEAGPIDAVLHPRGQTTITPDDQRRWLQGMVHALGQQRTGNEKYYFIKFDSWHTLDLALIREAFPNTPWIFIYRDPVEVMVSNLKQPSAQMIPAAVGTGLPGLDLSSRLQITPEEYCARVLARFCQAVLEHHHPGALLVNYCQLPEFVGSTLLDFFQINYTSADIERMRHVSQFDTKKPDRKFANDTPSKNQLATDLIRQMANRWLSELYVRLESKREAISLASFR